MRTSTPSTDAEEGGEDGAQASLGASGRATPLEELRTQARRNGLNGAQFEAWDRSLLNITLAIEQNFPENIFCDLDALAYHLAGLESSLLRESTARIVQLQEVFGIKSHISFRYAHDFLYGFDWAKWVRCNPGERQGVGPYDIAFLDYIKTRGFQILELIEQDDVKYPKLDDGRPRNPFGFSREPAAEAQLHRVLAERGLIPLRAWASSPEPKWDRDFADARSEVAMSLGLS